MSPATATHSAATIASPRQPNQGRCAIDGRIASASAIGAQKAVDDVAEDEVLRQVAAEPERGDVCGAQQLLPSLYVAVTVTEQGLVDDAGLQQAEGGGEEQHRGPARARASRELADDERRPSIQRPEERDRDQQLDRTARRVVVGSEQLGADRAEHEQRGDRNAARAAVAVPSRARILALLPRIRSTGFARLPRVPPTGFAIAASQAKPQPGHDGGECAADLQDAADHDGGAIVAEHLA